MKLTVCRCLAAVSIVAVLGIPVGAALRPRYGGTLRVESRGVFRTIDPADVPQEATDIDAKNRWVSQVFETLVRVDERGEPVPWLATMWTHDLARKRWVFTVRPKVQLHNDAPWSPPGGLIEIPDDRPIEQILRDLARPRNAIVVRGADGLLLGTGPFRVQSFAGNKLVLSANDAYWGGRPYLDSIEVQLSRTPAEQEADFDTTKADVIETPITAVRTLRQKGAHLAATQPEETIALVFDPKVPQNLRDAVALSIDRASLAGVVLQKQAEPSGALLPQWMSGYSFVFPQARDVARAKQLASGVAPLTLAYDRSDSILRAVGDRVAVNASDSGITLKPTSGASDLRLVRLPITSPDPWAALSDLAGALRTSLPVILPNWYEAERAVLRNNTVVPLVQFPRVWATGPLVRDWPVLGASLADVWLDTIPRKP